MNRQRKRQSDKERRDEVLRTPRPRTYSVSAPTGSFHLRWLEYIQKRRDSGIGGLKVA